MRHFCTCFSGALLCAVLFAADRADAKTITMAPIDRKALETACRHAGGRPFGIDEESGTYGCNGSPGSIQCSADGTCLGFVGDTMPMAGNSIEALIGGQTRGPVQKVGPMDARIDPRAQ